MGEEGEIRGQKLEIRAFANYCCPVSVFGGETRIGLSAEMT